MKNFLVACFIVLAFSFNVFGKLAVIPLDEALKRSDLIIVGTLQNISEMVETGTIYGKGEILVERHLAGNAETAYGNALQSGDRLKLNYIENFACVYGSHKRIENEKRIFLLTLNADGEIESEEFYPIDVLPEIKKLLGKGIKPGASGKTIRVLNDIEYSVPTPEMSARRTSDEGSCAFNSSKPDEKQYSPVQAVLVILTSLSLYFVLYRSRFKIR